MKRIIAVLLTVLLVLSVSMLFVSADETEGVDVYVTITDKDGKLALAYESVTVTDIDEDGALTVNDALYAAHEQFYEGGAAAGYATEMTKYGLSLTKLWGNENGYNYGYMINDASAWSMTDPVKADDYVAAYNFTDNVKFADKYSFFDQKDVDLGTDTVAVELTLKKNDFDEDWNPITVPVAGAELTVDGEPTGIFTDADGKAFYGFDANGDYLVSAVAADQVIVPPVCKVKVSAYAEIATPDQPYATEMATVTVADDGGSTGISATEAPATKDESTKDSSTKDQSTKDSSTTASSTTTPKTGDVTHLVLWIVIVSVCFAGIIGAVVFYKKRYGKK